MYTYPFERLDVWKEAKDLAVEIYKTTGFNDMDPTKTDTIKIK